jgi:2-methylcitrate dehydratase PrpD
LAQTHGLKASDIVSGHMIGHPIQKMLYEPLAQKQRPTTAIDAKFSLPFTVATALCRGEVTLASYRPECLRNEDILDLARRLSFAVDDDPSASNNATRGTLTLRTRTGEMLSMHIENPLGHSSRPMGEQSLRDKFTSCANLAKHPMPASQMRQIADAVLRLDAVSDLSREFFVLLS